jgi:hypothetical protein
MFVRDPVAAGTRPPDTGHVASVHNAQAHAWQFAVGTLQLTPLAPPSTSKAVGCTERLDLLSEWKRLPGTSKADQQHLVSYS